MPTRRRFIRPIVVALLLVVGLGGAAYFLFWPRPGVRDAGKDRDAVEEVAHRFARAMKGERTRDLHLLFTLKARKNVPAESGREKAGGAWGPGVVYEIAPPQIEGDTARVPFVLREAGEETKIVLHLRREQEEWRVFRMDMPFLGDDPLPIDFENLKDRTEKWTEKWTEPIDMFASKPGAKEFAADVLRSLDEKKFNDVWQEGLEVTDKQAGEVLRALAAKWKIPLRLTELQEQRVVVRPVTLKLAGISRWQLLEEVCRKVGHYPAYVQELDEHNQAVYAVHLRQLPRPLPVAFAGPFRVEVQEVNEFPSHALGALQVRTYTEGLPLPKESFGDFLDAGPSLQERCVKWTDITAADGADLHDRVGRAERSGVIGAPGWLNVDVVPLKNLLRHVTSVRACRGTVRVALPATVEQARFENPTSGTTRMAGKVTVTLKKAVKRVQEAKSNKETKKYPVHDFEFECRGVSHRRVMLAAYDAQHKLLGPTILGPGFRDTNGDVATIHYSAGGEAAVVVVKVITELRAVAYDIRLEDIPLQHAAEMPIKLEPPSFPGRAAPLSVELVRIDHQNHLPRCTMRTVNHSDKDVRAIEMAVTYPSADGKRFQTSAIYKAKRPEPIWVHSAERLVAEWKQSPVPVAVARRSTAEFVPDTWSSMLPSTVEGTAVRVRRVEFSDGTEWKAAP